MELSKERQEAMKRNKIITPLGAEIDPPIGHTVESWFQHCERMCVEADAEEKERGSNS